MYQKKFRCFQNKSDIYLYGDYNSDKGSHINIQLVRCENSTNPEDVVCKGDDDIQHWMRRQKIFFLFMFNQRRFDS